MPQGLDKITLQRQTLMIQAKEGWECGKVGRPGVHAIGQAFFRTRSLPQIRREARTENGEGWWGALERRHRT